VNPQLLHLVVNHLPVAGAVWTLLVLVAAVLHPAPPLSRLALILVILVGLSTLAAFLTGEGAEEVVEHLEGVREPAIEEHEELAERALYLGIAAGILALSTLILRRPPGRISLLTNLVLLLATALTLALTSHEGGKIHRPELGGTSGASSLPLG
jgi:hypothetical protein